MSAEAGKVIGFGGVFVKSRDGAALRAWYKDTLGIDVTDYGANFQVADESNADKAYTVWGVFADDTPYMAPSERPFMINFRVDDLDALVAKLKAKGVPLVGDVLNEAYGKFAWIVDPDGTKIELWQQIGGIPTP